MPVQKLKNFLDGRNVKYVTISHSKAYTAQEIAASAHIPGKELAKTVMVNVDGELAMAVLPASRQIDFEALKRVTGRTVELSSEDEFKERFPQCEVGAMPPFGNLYDMRVFVDTSLLEDEQIAFNAGTHTELVRLSLDDFRGLVEPQIASFARTS